MSDTTTDLQAGAPLDMLIAEKVMGWQRWNTHEDQARTKPIVRFFRPDRQHAVRAPAFSTDIAAAWEVLEHLRGQGMTINISTPSHVVVGDPHWTCYVWGANMLAGKARELSAPLAICAAALEALAAK